MKSELKEMLYELAYGIVSLVEENDMLLAENKQLKKEIDERDEQSNKLFKFQQEQVGETIKAFLDKCDRSNND